MTTRVAECDGRCCISQDPLTFPANFIPLPEFPGFFACEFLDVRDLTVRPHLCTIYERRPEFCRDNPTSGEKCPWCGGVGVVV